MLNEKSNKYDALTGLRCVAACMVFFYHNRKYWRNLYPDFLIHLYNEFYLGVSIFFVLSGFLIAFNYNKPSLFASKGYLIYLLKRLARIFPVYWLILTLHYLDRHFGNYHFSLLTYSLFHGFSNKFNLNAISQAWTLTVEMTYYFLAPFLLFLMNKRFIYLVMFLVALLLAVWGIGNWTTLSHLNLNSYFYPFEFVINGTFMGQASLFVIGMLLAKYISQPALPLSQWVNKIHHKTLIGGLSLLAIIVFFAFSQKDLFDQSNMHGLGVVIQLSILPLAIALFIWGLIVEDSIIRRLLSTRLMVLLGNSSFAFYLIHISYVNIKLKKYITLFDRNFTLLWVLSIGIYLLFEKPIYDLLKRLIDKAR